MARAVMTLEFDDEKRELGFEFDPYQTRDTLKRAFAALGDAACNTIGVKYQDQEQYKIYRPVGPQNAP